MTDDLTPAFGILLVDDEPAWLRALSLTLESSAGITNLFLCQESRDVLPLLEKGGIGLVLLDLTMPGLSGRSSSRPSPNAIPRWPASSSAASTSWTRPCAA